MASQDIWIIIVTIQFVMLLVAVVYMMSKPRSIGTIAPHVNLRMRDSQDVYEAQERAIHTFPYHTPFPRVSEPMRGPTLNVSTSPAPTPPPFRTYQPSHQTRADFQQVGYAYTEDKSKVLPVYSRPAPRNPSRFQYYTKAEGTDISMALQNDRGECLSDIGCQEIQTGDKVRSEAAEGELSVTIYDHV
jgi:hypothetical protein